jgi:hypothetical protein
MPSLRSEFYLHQRVRIDDDVPGIITMIRFHPGEEVDYLVAWWSNGEMREQWIDEKRLKDVTAR